MSDKRILEEARHNLERTDMYDARHLPPLGRRWGAFENWSKQHIARFSTVEEVVHFAQMQHGFELRERQPYLQHSIHQYEAKIRIEFPHLAKYIPSFSESPLSHPDTVMRSDGRPVSSMLLHLVRFFFVCLHYARRPRRICEIGGGYGAPARVWWHNPAYDIESYLIIDLPESLYFAEVFLRKEFGFDKVHYVVRPDERLWSGHLPGIILCPLPFLDALGACEFDSVTNTLSMQEMSEEWIDFYMNWLDRVNTPMFYSFNAFGRPIGNLQENVNTFSPRLSRNWVCRLKRFPYDELVAEILAERVNPNAPEPLKAHEDLYRLMEGRSLDRNVYLELIDSIRYTGDKRAVFATVERVITELPWLPKEIHYFLSCLSNSAADLDPEQRAKIVAYLDASSKERRMGREGVTIPIVESEISARG